MIQCCRACVAPPERHICSAAEHHTDNDDNANRDLTYIDGA